MDFYRCVVTVIELQVLNEMRHKRSTAIQIEAVFAPEITNRNLSLNGDMGLADTRQHRSKRCGTDRGLDHPGQTGYGRTHACASVREVRESEA